MGEESVPTNTWDAAVVEKLLRDGHCIYFENPGVVVLTGSEGFGIALFDDNKFQFVAVKNNPGDELPHEEVQFESESFLEFSAWCAFMGRDFL